MNKPTMPDTKKTPPSGILPGTPAGEPAKGPGIVPGTPDEARDPVPSNGRPVASTR